MMSHEFRGAAEAVFCSIAKQVVAEGLEELTATPFCAAEFYWACDGVAASSAVD